MKTREELYAVLVSLAGDTLLLPNAAVAEVMSPERLERPAAGAPPWFGGTLLYGNRKLPVVRFEILNGSNRVEDTRRTRLAIVHTITNHLSTGQYAVICQGYPHLVTLNRAALRAQPPQPGDVEGLVLTRVSIANTNALIPNLETVEQQIASLHILAGAA